MSTFDYIRRLGSGHFGEVWLANDVSLGVQRAVKLIPPDKVPDPHNFFYEAQALKAAAHDNVVEIIDAGTMSDGRIYLSMEYLPQGSLEDESSGSYLDLSRARKMMCDALRGLEHSHAKGILHRDIKPANILIGPNREGKLSDFGLAVPMNVNPAALGMKEYFYVSHLAPEVHLGKPFTAAADIYACGITLYRLVNGDSYLPQVAAADLGSSVVKGLYPDRNRYRAFVPPCLRKLINRAISIKPSERFVSANDMRHALEQIPIFMNWHERSMTGGTIWTGNWDSMCYDVALMPTSPNSYSVVVRKGSRRSNMRRMVSTCRENISREKAAREAGKVLQAFVLHKIK